MLVRIREKHEQVVQISRDHNTRLRLSSDVIHNSFFGGESESSRRYDFYCGCPRNSTMYATSAAIFLLGPILDTLLLLRGWYPHCIGLLLEFLKIYIYCTCFSIVTFPTNVLSTLLPGMIAGLFEFKLVERTLVLSRIHPPRFIIAVIYLVDPLIDLLIMYRIMLFFNQVDVSVYLMTVGYVFCVHFVSTPSVWVIFNIFAWVSFLLVGALFITGLWHIHEKFYDTPIDRTIQLFIYSGAISSFGFVPKKPYRDELWLYILRRCVGVFSRLILHAIRQTFFFMVVLFPIFLAIFVT